jgi:glycosyltransferase involved in cell wall biosynthesis
MQIKAIHQFHPSCSSGDGVTSGMIFTRRLLRELGFASDIYCDHIPADMTHEAIPRSRLKLDADDLLLLHHSLGYEDSAWLDQVAAPKILVYHNITPEHLLPDDGILRRLSRLGREQLKQWAPSCLGGIGDSESNSAELRDAGYRNVACLPLLLDLYRIRQAPWDAAVGAPLRNAINLLFVGRICENKRQLELLDVLHEFLHFAEQPVRLILAGGTTSGEYEQRIKARIAELHLQDNVLLTGKVPDATLLALYRCADAFVCLSEHEGFGMPLIEAMLFDVPVIANATSSIPDTLGKGGLLLQDPAPREMAALLQMVISEPAMRRRVLAAQRQNLQRFAPDRLQQGLAQYLAGVGVDVPAPPASGADRQARSYWQIEGPFDSNYSLALVNRELARAFHGMGTDIGLRSMEGTGEFDPSADFLRENPDCAQLARRAQHAQRAEGDPDVTLRFCYPPVADNMRGVIRGFHSYGWEETGFPVEYTTAFNRRLDVVSVLSRFVEKVLRDSGVRIPMAVTGGGVDHLLPVTPQPCRIDARGFRFLHVSSCFPRKGVDALLAAYGKAFRDTDDVSLVIKTFPNPHNDVEQQLQRLRQQDAGYPHVVIINRDIGLPELVGLYQASHAFVAPSRGEGLGLPMAEAMLFHLPVITTAWGGQTDFCDASTAWLCDYRFAKSQSHMGIGHSVWAEPDVDHLAALLKTVHGLSPEQSRERTEAARRRILRDYTWERVAQRIEHTVGRLQQQPLLRNEPRIGWVSTWNTRCGIASYSSFLAAGLPADRVTILANRTSDTAAPDDGNVRRCWNMHHDETLDDMFEVIREQNIGAVVIQYNFGFFSLAAFARLIDRLREANIGVHCFFHATADLYRNGARMSLQDIAPSLARADRLYVHGVQDLNRFKDYGLVDNVVYFPHGVLAPLAAPTDSERQAAGVAGKRIIASYGFLLPHKGIRHLIRAFASLATNDPSLHLLLLNSLYPAPESAQEQQACEALIAELGIAKSVTFSTDFLTDGDSLARLRLADLIVFPYQQTGESSSAAVRFGLAAGRPVAVTPLSIFDDVAEAVHKLPGTDADALAAGIQRVLADSSALAQQADRAKQWAASRHWPLLSVRLMNLIDGLANPL